MIIKCFKVGWLATNCYVVSCEETKEAALIDPGIENETEVNQILEYIKKNNLHVKFIINTHGHPDHISGNAEMKKATGASILIYETHNGRAYADQKLRDGDIINVGITAQQIRKRTYYFRLSACETDIIRNALEEEGFEVIAAMD